MKAKQNVVAKSREMQLVTPAIAEKWLNSNVSNRKLRDGVVEQYTQDMMAGKWTRCLVPIAFYADGAIADGQHRLWAILESKVAQKFYIEYGLSKEEGLNIDTGLTRSAVDNAKLSGADPNLSNALISICRSIEEGVPGHQRTSVAHKLAIVNRHREVGEWVVAHGPKGKNLMNGAITGAIGRAWYKVEDKDKLHRFCDVLRTGFSEGLQESAAVSLRNYLQASPRSATAALWRDTFLRTQNAIKHFMAGKPLTLVKPTATEVYPL